jgi:hypothetical protein
MIRGESIPVIYSNKSKIIITVLRNSWIGKRNGKFFLKPKKRPKKKTKEEFRLQMQHMRSISQSD